MRLALLSDAHANHLALGHATTWLEPRVDRFLFAGDAFSDHRFCNEVVETLRRLDASWVLGNHEMSLLGPAGTAARTSSHVRAELLEHVSALPTRIDRVFDGITVTMVHASPWPPFGQYLTPGHPALRRCAELDTDVLVLGHAHVPFAERSGATLVVNPGSVGRADGPGGADLLTFAILNTRDLAVTHYGFAGNDGEISELVPRR
jgi:putative phosphoesterase